AGERRLLMEQVIVDPRLAQVMHQAGQGQIARSPPRPAHEPRQPVDIDGDATAVLVGDYVALADDAAQVVDDMLSVAACHRLALLYACQRNSPRFQRSMSFPSESVAWPAATRQW